MTQRELIATATLEELIAFLSQDKEADLTQYGKDGWGSLEKLLDEIRKCDVTLHYNPENGYVEAVRIRARGIVDWEGYRLHEVKRKRPKKGGSFFWTVFGFLGRWRTVEKLCEYAISETMQRHLQIDRRETSKAALRRGFWEEWQLRVEEDLLRSLLVKDGRDKPGWSTTYPRIWSVGFSYWFHVQLSQHPWIWDPIIFGTKLLKRPWIWDPIIKDEGTLIYLEWFWNEPGEDERYLKLQWKVLVFFVRIWVRVRYLF